MWMLTLYSDLKHGNMANDKLNMRLERVQVQQVKVQEPKQIQNGKNKGKDFWGIGIKTIDGWMNAMAFSEEDKDAYAQLEDKTVHLSVWEEMWQDKHYTKCGFPSKVDLIDIRMKELEDKMAGVTKFLHYYCSKNEGAAEELKNYTKQNN